MLCIDFKWGIPEPMETPSLCPCYKPTDYINIKCNICKRSKDYEKLSSSTKVLTHNTVSYIAVLIYMTFVLWHCMTRVQCKVMEGYRMLLWQLKTNLHNTYSVTYISSCMEVNVRS